MKFDDGSEHRSRKHHYTKRDKDKKPRRYKNRESALTHKPPRNLHV